MDENYFYDTADAINYNVLFINYLSFINLILKTMAILNSGIWGTSQNALGNTVTYVVKGRTIARTKSATYRDKNTATQQLQRARFNALVVMGRQALATIRTAFQSKMAYHSGFNAFMTSNLKPENFEGSTANPIYASLVLAKGTLQSSPISVAKTTDLQKRLDIAYNSYANGVTGNLTDKAYCFLWDDVLKEGITLDLDATREDGAGYATYPSHFVNEGDNFYVYLYFKTADGVSPVLFSDSDYSSVSVV